MGPNTTLSRVCLQDHSNNQPARISVQFVAWVAGSEHFAKARRCSLGLACVARPEGSAKGVVGDGDKVMETTGDRRKQYCRDLGQLKAERARKCQRTITRMIQGRVRAAA